MDFLPVFGCVKLSTSSTFSTRSPPSSRMISNNSLSAKSSGTHMLMSFRTGGYLEKGLNFVCSLKEVSENCFKKRSSSDQKRRMSDIEEHHCEPLEAEAE